jgi:hypothetical protein
MNFKNIDINNIEKLMVDKIKQYLNSLEVGKLYAVLPILKNRLGKIKLYQ